ncbi:hypothetical protein CEP54_009685 [Fusarium duplospermum]|uniref:F-box domain-containing protein n=1 Tax=Fusarium duplospermum TaxID=1325734 RepID=A0A428PP56_9HYPO|nr:hypothetical protein CEP54_009685 [Fusarium duplospermum]
MTMEQGSPVPSQFRHDAYARLRLNDHTLSQNLPPLQPKPENGRSHFPPATGIGALDALPVELLNIILAEIDLQTLVSFRCVNRRAAEVVDHIPSYKAVMTHAPHALRGILSIETGRWIACIVLYEKLCLAKCETCSDLGDYLYLVTCKRVCFLCLSQDRLYLPVTPRQACREFGLTSGIVDTLPRMRVVPGIYSPNEKKAVKSILVDYKSCLDTAVALHGSMSAMRKYVSDMEARKPRAAGQQAGSDRVQPLQAGHIDGRSGNPFRFVTITQSGRRTLVTGVHLTFVPCLAAHWRYSSNFVQLSVDPEGESEFRLLINDRFIKYITIDNGVFDSEDMCFGPSLISLLPPLPPGDWNTACICHDPATGTAHFVEVERARLLGIETTWHHVNIDYLNIQLERKLRSNVYEVTCPGFSSIVVAKFARFPWEIPQLEKETEAYKWIEGHHIGPPFLGHLSEEGRVIGFIMANMTDCHHATPGDFDLCHQTLTRLHQLGIKHGDINKHNFLIHAGEATLIDFDSAVPKASACELQDELSSLQHHLRDTSGRGGRVIEQHSA